MALSCIWKDGEGVFKPADARSLREARDTYGDGEVVALDAVKGRSKTSHDHFFAVIVDAWETLPESETRFPTAETLRSWALCKSGYCDVETFVASSKAEALKLAGFVRKGNVWVTVNGPQVTRLTPHSQSMKAMGGKVFQESKSAVLDVIGTLLETTPETLARAA